MNDITKLLPDMKTGEELISEILSLPDYQEEIRYKNVAERLIALSDMYKIYIPSKMTEEIYSKLYLALLRSMQKKFSKPAILQRNENYKATQKQNYLGIMGGSDSFTVIGDSGIGKSSAIGRSVDLLMEKGIIETKSPYTKVIPCLIVQCPFDSSVKGLLLEILQKVDQAIGSEYYKSALKTRVTTDMLIGSVSQVAINHIGLLIVDEIQNVVNSKHGKSLVGMLTQLINNSGISICMVGTPESSVFFEQAMQLARRSLGLNYGALEYDQEFYNFCKIVFNYQYTNYKSEISECVTRWLYEHSGGIVSIMVSLIHDAQEIAILNGTEILNLESLEQAYKKRLVMLHGYVETTITQTKLNVRKKTDMVLKENECVNNDFSIAELVEISKENDGDTMAFLHKFITVEEVKL